MTDKRKERCEVCRFAHQHYMHQSSELQCRVNPPRGVTMESWAYRDKAVWPTVDDRDWCGKFELDQEKLENEIDRREMHRRSASHLP